MFSAAQRNAPASNIIFINIYSKSSKSSTANTVFRFSPELGRKTITHSRSFISSSSPVGNLRSDRIGSRGKARPKRNIISRIESEHGITLDFAVDAEVKSTLLRNEKARQRHPFSLYQTDEERMELVNEFYSQLEKCNVVLISVVIDKKQIIPCSRLANQQELHNKAWELLCERVESFMNERHPKHKAILITDDTDKQKNLQTTRAHVNLYKHGASSGLSLRHIVEMPLFVSSATCVGVQLADLCCYNVYRRFKDDNPDYEFFKRIEPFFYNSDNTDPNKKDGLKVFPSAGEAAR